MWRGGAKRQPHADFLGTVRHGVRDDRVDPDRREEQQRGSEHDEHPGGNTAEEQVLLDVLCESADVVDRQRGIKIAHDPLHLRREERFRPGPRAQVHLAAERGPVAVGQPDR